MSDAKTSRAAAPAPVASAPVMTLAEACNETRSFARVVKGLSRLAEVADALASADQAVADRRREEAGVLADIEKARSELESLKAALEGARNDAAKILAEARDQAGAALNAAHEQAGTIVADANKAAAAARAEAHDMVTRKSAAETAAQKAESELNALLGRLEMAKGEARKIIGE